MKKAIPVILAVLLSFALMLSACVQNSGNSGSSGNNSSSSSSGSSSSGNSSSEGEQPEPDEPDILDGYEKSCAVTEFSSENLSKVNLKPTFDVSDCVFDAEDIMFPISFSATECACNATP